MKGPELPDNATIYLSRGRHYIGAADRLIDSGASTIEFYDPLAMLFLFSLEINLKACLAHMGLTIPRGHSIDDYLIAAIEQGLKISTEPADEIFRVAVPYRLHAPRYAPLKETVSMRSIKTFQFVAHHLLERSTDFISGTVKNYPSVPVSLQDAKSSLDRVIASYREEVGQFDPEQVWTNAEHLPYSLGTMIKPNF